MTLKQILYISGPMTGYKDYNFPAFKKAAQKLRSQRYRVRNPAENFAGRTNLTRSEYMRQDIKMLLDVEGVVVLPGWEKSRGAQTEIRVALELGLPIYRLRNKGRLWDEFTPPLSENILVEITEEAKRIIFGEEAEVEKDSGDSTSTPDFRETNKEESVITPHEPSYYRKFNSGATRDTDDSKLQYARFLSPIVVKRYAEYMHENRKLRDGSMRDPDNWKKGIPLDAYMDSLFRHVMDVWLQHNGYPGEEGVDTALCAVIFNAQGYLFEWLKANPHSSS